MKKLFVLMSLVFSLGVSAQNVESVGTVELGSPYAVALEAIKAEFGDSQSVSEDQVVFNQKRFHGFMFDEVKFCFKNGKFNEARFYQQVGSKAEAQKKMEQVAQTMKAHYSLSRDVEEDHTWFYKGGLSPLGIGHLFTIYTYRKQGAYGVELRYGPINFPQ